MVDPRLPFSMLGPRFPFSFFLEENAVGREQAYYRFCHSQTCITRIPFSKHSTILCRKKGEYKHLMDIKRFCYNYNILLSLSPVYRKVMSHDQVYHINSSEPLSNTKPPLTPTHTHTKKKSNVQNFMKTRDRNKT